jgi:hypothetical protein
VKKAEIKPSVKKVAAYKKPHMKSISLSSKKDTSREKGIIIVRPDVKVVDSPRSAPMTLAQARMASATTAKVVSSPRIVDATQRNGPRFVFSD